MGSNFCVFTGWSMISQNRKYKSNCNHTFHIFTVESGEIFWQFFSNFIRILSIFILWTNKVHFFRSLFLSQLLFISPLTKDVAFYNLFSPFLRFLKRRSFFFFFYPYPFHSIISFSPSIFFFFFVCCRLQIFAKVCPEQDGTSSTIFFCRY